MKKVRPADSGSLDSLAPAARVGVPAGKRSSRRSVEVRIMSPSLSLGLGWIDAKSIAEPEDGAGGRLVRYFREGAMAGNLAALAEEAAEAQELELIGSSS